MNIGWTFLNEQATFRLCQAADNTYVYFPLVNEAGMMSAITPKLHGDIKTDQNHFLTPPVSVEDLHNTHPSRDFWVFVEDNGPWSLAGNSARQMADRWTDQADQVTVEAGFLWHKTIRRHGRCGLQAEVLNFVPAGDDRVELMQVTLTNVGNQSLRLTPTAAILLYGRSADNLRDHRHVTSLLHRVRCHTHGVLLRPTMSFDERGHLPNSTTYAVLGVTDSGDPPSGFWPVVEDFIGEGGTLDWPQAIVQNLPVPCGAGDKVDGYEALGGLQFPQIELAPGQSQGYVLILAILDEETEVETLLARYGGAGPCRDWLSRTQDFWEQKLDTLRVGASDPRFDSWLRWVALQPTLRRLFGNSFLPYHDYGRGGRGWRDLWQDILALLIMEGDDVGDTLWNHFAGVRLDGSNATIIGNKPGEFKADRNDIPRVWMDHGAWPLLTVRLYIDQSGDLDFLLREQVYFKDQHTHRCRQIDEHWTPEQGTVQRTQSGAPYRGTVFEHLLVQHLTAFHHVGEHNVLLLEGADWNDGLDMARNRGESVAFSAMYAWNLRQLAELADALLRAGVRDVDLAVELVSLLARMDFDDAPAKRRRLQAYFDTIRRTVSGDKISISLDDLAATLRAMADWLAAHIRRHEWVTDESGLGWFNGYYDDNGRQVEGPSQQGVRMTLTGQVFSLMGGVADEAQVDAVLAAADRHLYDPAVGGYRLNTDFGQVKLDLGRAFGFAFGHKENGAMFSHMAVMYAHALYRRRRTQQAWKVLADIYRHCQDFPRSRTLPGIPEYINPRGRCMYPWLTGSASWFILTLVQLAYGVRGEWGDLVLDPQLTGAQFDAEGRAEIETLFAGRRLVVRYHNPQLLEAGAYRPTAVIVDGQHIQVESSGPGVRLKRAALLKLAVDQRHYVDVYMHEQNGT